MNFPRLPAAILLLLALVPPRATRAAVDFNRDIRPILSDNCYHCHGPDAKARKADLRLDTKDGAFRVKDGKRVIHSGNATQSELHRRLVTADPDDLMPPAKSNRKLTPAQIELVRRWIDEGARWSQHWAFIAPERPAIPRVQNPAWPRNAIDHFILAELEGNGLAPTHADLFDYKPRLAALHGKPVPDEYIAGKRFSTMTGVASGKLLLAPVEPFQQHGRSGAWVSAFLPFTAAIADELCFLKSMHTDAVNHAPAISFLLSGGQIPGRPTLGAWLTYGLGSEADTLPAFTVMTSVSKGTSCGQIFYDFYWGSGFLPSKYQGVKFRGNGEPVLYLGNPEGISAPVRRGILDDLAQLNELKLRESGDPEIATRIAQYELAYRMQTSVPELTDLTNEPAHVLEMYGPDVKQQGSFAYNCLMARRLIERGVRFVQLMHAGWDQHNSLTTELYNQCRDTDQPSAALVKDLKQRGLLDDTLVIGGGEFGRTPFIQGNLADRKRWGRDHHPYAFTVWLAGGGVKAGLSHGASDDLAMNAVKDPVHVHDFQATLLHLLGIHHEQLTFKFQGRHFRLTDVHGEVVRAVLA